MVYIQLATPIREFDRARIKEVSFFDTNGETNREKAISFKYQVYKKIDDIYVPLYEKRVHVSNQQYINTAMAAPSGDLSAYDFTCKQLLRYVIDNSLESGTIEFL